MVPQFNMQQFTALAALQNFRLQARQNEHLAAIRRNMDANTDRERAALNSERENLRRLQAQTRATLERESAALASQRSQVQEELESMRRLRRQEEDTKKKREDREWKIAKWRKKMAHAAAALEEIKHLSP